MKILVTGSAGFIGSYVVIHLLNSGHLVIGIDNHNNYYDPILKDDRLDLFRNNPNYTHYFADIADQKVINEIFDKEKLDYVINLAAQAGIRHSINNPYIYIESNIIGFLNILEASRIYQIKHLVYASSSSVYGANTSIPFSTKQSVDHPLNLYAATKKANELMAHTYSSLYQLPTTGVRFFTVYGPWGRPDMAPFLFIKSILDGNPIKIYNFGNHKRDFTYIDDIVEGLIKILYHIPVSNVNWNTKVPDLSTSFAPWKLYNIGNNKPINILQFIEAIESATGKKAIKEFLPLQPGDIQDTWADISDLVNEIGYTPKTSIEDGVNSLVSWYIEHYKYKYT